MRNSNVAVVIPVYNRATTVLHTLSSVAEQTVQPKQLVIVDDGSTDESVTTISEWIAAQKLPSSVSLVRQINQGAGAARNRGCSEVRDCEYVAFLDSDDRWPAGFLQRAVAKLDTNRGAVAATADRLYHRQNKSRPGFHGTRRIEPNASSWLMTHDAGIASCTVFRANVIRNLQGFNPSIETGQDIELFLRISRMGSWLHVSGAPVNFYIGFSARNGEDANLSSKYVDRNHRWAQIREQFIFCQQGNQVIPEKIYGPVLAKLYHKAACDYQSLGRVELAEMCFRKAAEYRPFLFSNWWRRLRLQVPRQAAAS